MAPRPTGPARHHRGTPSPLDRFRHEYNATRPHRSLPHRATPATLYDTLPKALPVNSRDAASHDRVRHDRVDKSGTITLRVAGQLRHIGIGRTHARTHVILLIQDLDVRIINATTSELLRELTIDLNRDYQPQNRKIRTPNEGSDLSDLLRDHMVGLTGFEPAASSSRTKRATKLRHSPKPMETVPERPACARIGGLPTRQNGAAGPRVSRVASGRHQKRTGAKGDVPAPAETCSHDES